MIYSNRWRKKKLIYLIAFQEKNMSQMKCILYIKFQSIMVICCTKINCIRL